MTLATKPFYITFGSQYNRVRHPRVVNGVSPHPDGWIVLDAISKDHAMQRAKAFFGDTYSMCYSPEDFDSHSRSFYPKGELAHVPFVPGQDPA